MQPVSLNDLIAATGGTPVGVEGPEQRFARIQMDSRQVVSGDIFWAVKGERHNGHRFLKDAFAAGATLAIVDQKHSHKLDCPHIEVEDTLLALWQFANWYRTQFDVLVIGVTGSVGKTTTRRMIHSVLSANYSGVESPSNFNNRFGVPLSLLQIEQDHEFAVIELGASQTGEIGELATVAQPEIGVITAIGPAHLDGFHSVENIIKTKGELLASLPESGFAVLNGDDRNIRKLADSSNCPVIFVGEKDGNALQAREITVENGWLGFHVDDTEFRVPATGRHNIAAALVAIASGRQIGMTDADIIQGLRTFTSASGRCDALEIGPWTIIDDTYNASPQSMSVACQTLKEWQTTGKRILVLGDMLELGEWSDDFHRLLGEEIARTNIDKLITVGPQAAIAARTAKMHGMDAGCLGACRDHDLALMLLDCWLEAGDVVLVKGSRGMKMEAIIERLQKTADQQRETQTAFRHVA